MAVETRRGCGFRKVGGLYLVGGGIGLPCDRLPLALCTCPTCGQGIKQSRGWTWVEVAALVQGPHILPGLTKDAAFHLMMPESCCDPHPCGCCVAFGKILSVINCRFCYEPETMGRAGLLWIGEKFYATPADFISEGINLGFSRRIKSSPRGFKAGETWVLLAHSKAIRTEVPAGAGAFEFTSVKAEYKPGVFYVWLPQRVEKICLESQRDSEEIADLEKRGITPVFVPDDDTDHQGSVYDDPESEQLELGGTGVAGAAGASPEN